MSTPIHLTIWGEANTGTAPVILIHGTMSWGTDEQYGFATQRSLADHFRLMIVDRRGYGASPDLTHDAYLSDYAIDAQDVIELLADGAHLVGHSYGGVVAMLAAGRCPQAVRSLTLIEPGAYRMAEQDPIVAAALRPMREAMKRGWPDFSAQEWLRLSTESVGLPMPEPTPARLRAAWTAMRERPCWEAEIPVEELAAASWPKLVISGTWETAPAVYRAVGGEPLMACARVVAQRIGAQLLRVPGASHWAHREQSEIVNAALRKLWGQ